MVWIVTTLYYLEVLIYRGSPVLLGKGGKLHSKANLSGEKKYSTLKSDEIKNAEPKTGNELINTFIQRKLSNLHAAFSQKFDSDNLNS